MKRHLEKAAESFNAAHMVGEPFATPKRDEFAVFSGMTSTMRTVASAPLPLLCPSSVSSTPSPPEMHRTTSGSIPRLSQPAAPQPSLRPAGIETESPPWSQVHPALIDQLLSFESQIEPSVAGGGYIYGPPATSESSRTHLQLQFSTSTGHENPSKFAYTQQALRGHPRSHDPQYSEGSSPASTTSDASTRAPHTAMQPQFARPLTPPPPPDFRARDPVLRQSGSLSLTDAWSQFMMQMDNPPVAPHRPS